MKSLIILLALALPTFAQDLPYEIERARASAADAVANTIDQVSPPTPPAPPAPGDTCYNCNGTGRSGDGLSICRVCGGDGKLINVGTPHDVSYRLDALEDAIRRLGTRLLALEDDRWQESVTRKQCRCWETGKCTCDPLLCDCEECIKHRPQKLKGLTEAQAQAQAQSRPVLLYFTANWCGPCHEYEANVLNSVEVQAALRTNRVLFSKVDIDGVESSALNKWGVRIVPTVILVTADWKQRETLTSTRDAKQLAVAITEAAKRSKSGLNTWR